MAQNVPVASPRTNAGDPRRTIALLWRHHLPATSPARGPRQRLDVDDVVARAVELADAEGIEAVTVRRVAAALGVATMNLYTYVPGKEELLDLMLDQVYTQMPDVPAAGPHWRDRVDAVARANRALFERHPWAAAVATPRPGLGPGATAKYERELAALDGLDLDDVTMDAALAWALAFVQAWAREAVAANAARTESGQDDSQWWADAGPVLAEVLDADRFPLAARVGTAAGQAQDAAWVAGPAFEFGLARVLDGLAGLVHE